MPLSEYKYLKKTNTGKSKNKINDKVFDRIVDIDQEEDLFNQPSSTAVPIDKDLFAKQQFEEDLMNVPYELVKGTKVEDAWLDVQSELYGTVSKEKRSTIQRKADEFYQSGPIGATVAAVADILPGIPFVDIIDPPEKLTGEGMQSARNILGILGAIGSIYKTPQAVGRVATNIREPWGYGNNIEQIKNALTRMDHKRTALGQIKRAAKAIIKDKPMYGRLDPAVKGMRFGPDIHMKSAAMEAREFLYRSMFGLKPRAGKNIFLKNKDGTLSFNPESKRAKLLTDWMVHDIEHTGHPVMGWYKRTLLEGEDKLLGAMRSTPKLIEYEDIWDFKMNPSDWSRLFGAFKKSPKEAALGTGEAAVRSLVHLITSPSHIKGKYRYIPDDYMKTGMTPAQ